MKLIFDEQKDDLTKEDLSCIVNWRDSYSCLSDIRMYLRDLNKYQSSRLETITGEQAAEEIYSRFFEILEENNINMDII